MFEHPLNVLSTFIYLPSTSSKYLRIQISRSTGFNFLRSHASVHSSVFRKRSISTSNERIQAEIPSAARRSPALSPFSTAADFSFKESEITTHYVLSRRYLILRTEVRFLSWSTVYFCRCFLHTRSFIIPAVSEDHKLFCGQKSGLNFWVKMRNVRSAGLLRITLMQ